MPRIYLPGRNKIVRIEVEWNVLCTRWHSTEMCGFYECEECANRFLSLKIGPKLVCPYCGEEPDMEIGPDEEMPVAKETAKLLEVVEGAENVERMDALLSLAVTGGDYEWI